MNAVYRCGNTHSKKKGNSERKSHNPPALRSAGEEKVMNPVSDVVLNSSKDEINAARRETTELNTEVVELGMVSETQGGILGPKPEAGMGFQNY